MGFLTRVLEGLHAPWWALALVASLVTMALAGTVVILATPAGCRTAQSLHVSNANCGSSGGSPIAQLGGTPPPTTTARPTVLPGSSPSAAQTPFQEPSPSPQPTPTPLVPYSYPPSSALPPYGIVGSTPLPGDVSPTCRLPISQGQSGSGGFIVLPGGTYVADPRSSVSVPAGAPPLPPPQMGQQSGFGISYDSVHARWLPVPFNWVSPDGSRYAYLIAQGIVVVNTADNSFSTLGAGRAWNILSVDAQGVYATVQQTAGLWLLPFSGGAQQLTSSGFWQGVAAGAAYGTSASAVPQGVANPILRLDLKTGTTQTWFTVDGATEQVVGFDGSGSPLIVVNYNPNAPGENVQSYLWSVPTLGGGLTIAVVYGPGYYQPDTFLGFYPPVIDGHGMWFGSGLGIFLFIPYKAWYLASTFNGTPAGACA